MQRNSSCYTGGARNLGELGFELWQVDCGLIRQTWQRCFRVNGRRVDYCLEVWQTCCNGSRHAKLMNKVDHLFIVGAGFSHHAGLPLTTDFSEKLLDVSGFQSLGPNNLIVKFLHQFVQDTFNHKAKAAAKFWPHLEDIFTCVDLSANTGHHLGPEYSPSHLRTVRRALIVHIIRMLRHSYTEGKELHSNDWEAVECFFSMVAPRNCAFLCMNWDTVIEEGLNRANTDLTDFDYGCDAIPAQFYKSSIRASSVELRRSVRIVKLHGSANWLYCDVCRNTFWFSPGETLRIAEELFRGSDWDVVEHHIRQRYPHSDAPHECPTCRATGLGTRFATFSYRKALDFPMYERSWLTAERLLREAQTWIFIGYSLPAADYEFKHLMKHVQLSRKPPPALILITGGNGAKETQRNYQKFFGPQLGASSAAYFDKGLDIVALNYLKDIGALTESHIN